jgi:hypothetical protein
MGLSDDPTTVLLCCICPFLRASDAQNLAATSSQGMRILKEMIQELRNTEREAENEDDADFGITVYNLSFMSTQYGKEHTIANIFRFTYV